MGELTSKKLIIVALVILLGVTGLGVTLFRSYIPFLSTKPAANSPVATNSSTNFSTTKAAPFPTPSNDAVAAAQQFYIDYQNCVITEISNKNPSAKGTKAGIDPAQMTDQMVTTCINQNQNSSSTLKASAAAASAKTSLVNCQKGFPSTMQFNLDKQITPTSSSITFLEGIPSSGTPQQLSINLVVAQSSGKWQISQINCPK